MMKTKKTLLVLLLALQLKGLAQSEIYKICLIKAKRDPVLLTQNAKRDFDEFKIEKNLDVKNKLAQSSMTQAQEAVRIFQHCQANLDRSYTAVTSKPEGMSLRPGESKIPRVEALEYIASDLRYIESELLKAQTILDASQRYLQESYAAKGPILATVRDVTILGEPLRRHDIKPYFTRYGLNVSVGIQGDGARRGTVEVSIVDLTGKILGYGTVEFRAEENLVNCKVDVEIYQNEELFAVSKIFDQGVKGVVPAKPKKFNLAY